MSDETQLDRQPEPQTQTETEQPSVDVTNLMKALESEREARKRLEADIKEKARKEKEYEQSLERYKAIDPDRYQKMLEAERKREEDDLLRKRNFDELKERYRLENEAASKQATEWQRKYENTVVETALRTAFFENGGRRSGYDLDSQGVEEVMPVDAILNLMRDRIKLEDNKIVVYDKVGNPEFNSEGRPKTLTEKMIEFRKGSMGSLFESQSNATGGGKPPTTIYNGQPVKLFSKDQARNGRASIDDIASGKAYVQ